MTKHYAPFPCEPNMIRKSSASSVTEAMEEAAKDTVTSNIPVDKIITVKNYVVYPARWYVLFIYVLYSASNSLQWTQYTIISDIVVKYYGVDSTLVSWTSMVYMITYVPLIFPASWFLDKVPVVGLIVTYLTSSYIFYVVYGQTKA